MKHIITVTMNPCFDVTLWTDGLDPDAANRVLSETRDIGGKGINVSRVVKACGLDSLCLAVTGEEDSREFAAFLEPKELRYELLKVEGNVRENITVRYADQTVKLNRKGPFMTALMIGALMALIQNRMHPGDIVVFAGSLPENVKAQDYLELMMAVKKAGGLVAVDNETLTFEDYCRLSPWLMKPNFHELHKIMGVEESFESVFSAAKKLQHGGVENVLVSLGKEGLLLVSGDEILRATVPTVAVKSTAGAGDSALAGFLTGTVRNQPPEDCIRLAAACGTATVMMEAPALAEKGQIQELLGQIKVEHL